MIQSPIRLGILFGGRSSEHEVSLLSAREVMQAIDPKKYTVIPLGIDQNGSWHRLAWNPQKQLQAHGEAVTLLPDPTQSGLLSLSATTDKPINEKKPGLEDIDVIF